MKMNMDEEILAYQLRKAEQSNQSGWRWFFIIVFGVFIGNSASFGLEKSCFVLGATTSSQGCFCCYG